MNPERWQRIKAILNAALEHAPEDQSRVIQEECGGDAALADEVLSILPYATEGGFLETPPLHMFAQALGMSMEGHLVGPYRIVREIEAGGMGEVYEAEQEVPFHRRVALKLVKRGFDTSRVIARFDSERQALALMNHPSIAQVFDAGATRDGRPYFAMEFIQGEPITEHCDVQRASLRERLELFKRVCEGVQHAHQKGIVHRDLKPSNVLVTLQDGRPVPKIIDFGIAKALDPSGQAGSDEKIGTPGYMSPEQEAEESVDTRTDVYSLGVLLYELLVGELPLESQESVPQLASEQSVKLGERAAKRARDRRTDPSTLTRKLRGDLDWILTKALQKDRGCRYASVSELAIDIDRHLKDEPVLASPSTTVYRSGKFLQRHRLGVAAAGLVLLALVIGMVGAGLGLLRARRAEDVARQEARRASQEAETAHRISNFLVGLFKTSEPDKARGNAITAREILDAGSRKIAAELREEPEIKATLMNTMGEVYQSLGLLDGAEPLLNEALALRKARFGEMNAQVARSMNDLAELRRAQGRYPEAETLHRRALAIRVRVLGHAHPDVADSFNELGLLRWNQGRYREAESSFQKALTIWRKADDDLVVTALSHLAIVYRDDGKLDQATPLFEEMVALQEKQLGPEHPELMANLNNLSDIYRNQGRYAKAESLLKRVLSVNERVMGPEHPNVATSLNNLAMVYRVQGKYRDAEALYRRTLAIDEKVKGLNNPDVASSLHNLAVLYREEGRYSEAEPLFLRSLAMRQQLLGLEHPQTAGSLNHLAVLRAATGRPAEAERLFGQSLKIREKVLGPEHPHVAVTLTNLASLYQKLGRYREAEPLLTRALAIWELPQPNLPDLVTTLESAAAVLRQMGRSTDARAMDLRARGIRRKLSEDQVAEKRQ